MHIEIVFVTMLAVAAGVALIARRLRVPYTIALVFAGLLLGTSQAFEAPHLTKELLFAIFLPGLIFEAAFHLEFKRFWGNKIAILALAVPGIAVAMALTASILTPAANLLHFEGGLEFGYALVFAALISATDPIAVVSLFKTLGAPKRLAVLVEGESLLNDGTAVVFFTLVLGYANSGHVDLGDASFDFVRTVGLGIITGGVVGFAASKVIQQVDEPMIEITITTVAAYGSFGLAEQLHFSGVIATVVAGMLCGNYAARTGMSPSTRIAVESFWEYLVFALNSFVFLLIGFEVRLSHLLQSWVAILAAWVAVTFGRAAVIAVVTLLLSKTREKVPWKWSSVLVWGGLRGGLSMVLVLGLPADFPHRELLLNMTFGVVLISIVVQGLTMSPLLRRLGVVGGRHDRHIYEQHRGAILAANGALEALTAMAREKFAHQKILGELRGIYQQRLEEAEGKLADLHQEQEVLEEEEREAAVRHLLLVEKDTLSKSYHDGLLSAEALERLLVDVDVRLTRLETGRDPAGEVSAVPGSAPLSSETPSPEGDAEEE